MTYSIVARDPFTSDLGIAVQSKYLACGAVVPWARAGVGAIATQALAHTPYGSRGLDLLASGWSPEEAFERVAADDDARQHRQVGMVAADGRSMSRTGTSCLEWAGGRAADDLAVQGNLLAGPAVVDLMVTRYRTGGPHFAELLLDVLRAGQEAGGDRRGQQSAGLLIVREAGGPGGHGDRLIDLRVDDHISPIEELARLLGIHRLLFERATPDRLVALDETLAAELRMLLTVSGMSPVAGAADSAPAARAVGLPRPLPNGWDDAWQHALELWMGMENLEERTAARGWIDPGVLEHLRHHSSREIDAR